MFQLSGVIVAALSVVALVAALVGLVTLAVWIGVRLVRRAGSLNATFSEIIESQERQKHLLARRQVPPPPLPG